MFHQFETINLVMGIIGIFILFSIFRQIQFEGSAYFKSGFIVIVVSYLFTMAGNMGWKGLFNLLAHSGDAFSGFLFLAGCSKSIKASKRAALSDEDAA